MNNIQGGKGERSKQSSAQIESDEDRKKREVSAGGKILRGESLRML